MVRGMKYWIIVVVSVKVILNFVFGFGNIVLYFFINLDMKEILVILV